MLLTKEQISEQMCKHAQKKNGLHDLMEIMLESMMFAERSEFLVDNPGNKGNGYRPGSAYGHGRKLGTIMAVHHQRGVYLHTPYKGHFPLLCS